MKILEKILSPPDAAPPSPAPRSPSSWKVEGPLHRSRRQPCPSFLPLLPTLAFQRSHSDLEKKEEALSKKPGRLRVHIVCLN